MQLTVLGREIVRQSRLLPAEPAFLCGDDNSTNNSTNNSTTSGFGLAIFRAGGGSGAGFGLALFRAGGGSGAGFGLAIFRAGGGSGPDLDWRFSGPVGIPVVRSKNI